MLVPWQPRHFSLTLTLSLVEWSTFAFWWNSAAKSASQAVVSEPLKSRRVHVILFNLAFALVVLPVRKLTPDFCRMSSLPWLGFGIRSIFFALATWARRHLSPHWSSEITIKVNHEPIHPAHTV